jgi:hypothetical protein
MAQDVCSALVEGQKEWKECMFRDTAHSLLVRCVAAERQAIHNPDLDAYFEDTIKGVIAFSPNSAPTEMFDITKCVLENMRKIVDEVILRKH